MIKDSGQRTEYASGAVRDMSFGKGRFDLLPWRAVWEVAKHCEEGARKYGERNVDKGIPIHSFIDSAFRHLVKYTLGMDDENHLRAAAWNILWAMQTEIYHPELQDIPVWMEKQESSRALEERIREDSDRNIKKCLEKFNKGIEEQEDPPPKPTNADYIRSRTDKELAHYICSQGWRLGEEKECEEWLNSVCGEKFAQND